MSKLSKLFSKRRSTDELKKHQRALDKVLRELEREQRRSERQEQEIAGDLKKMVKKGGDMNAIRIKAKDLVRTRQNTRRMTLLRANIQAVRMKITTVQTEGAISQAMCSVTKALRAMNARMDLPHFQMMLREFERETEKASIKESMLEDVTDEAVEVDEEEESEAVVKQVLDELGLQVEQELISLPSTSKPPTTAPKVPVAAAELPDVDNELEARLNQLKRN